MESTSPDIARDKTLVNVLGVVYVHTKTSDGGDLYLTRFAERYEGHLAIENWYEREWFEARRIRLLGTGSVYRVPTKPVGGGSLDLVVKNCRVGEDVPLDTHTLKEFCDAEFNSPWEEFSLVMEMREGLYGPREVRINTQRPLAIYVPPERMQPWQSGRSRSRINRILARHPGIDIDTLKQYKLVYEWIRGRNLMELFEHMDVETTDIVFHLKGINRQVLGFMDQKGYLMADMKPEHVIVGEDDVRHIEELGSEGGAGAPLMQVDYLHRLLNEGRYSVIDYELLFRTPEHEDRVKSARRHRYLDDQRDRMKPTPRPAHLRGAEIFGVPYIYGHAESTGGLLWVVGRNARLFDYFLPERWRKTPSLSLSEANEVHYTVSKDNIHLVWRTSRVGELPETGYTPEEMESIRRHGINSPFEEFSLALTLNRLGIRAVYVRAVYMTGTEKVELSADPRKFVSHGGILDAEGEPILRATRNYITIRGYYNGPDEWVSEHEDALMRPVDLVRAVKKGIINGAMRDRLIEGVTVRLREAGYDGSLLRPNDLLLAIDAAGETMKDPRGEPEAIVCNLELIWKIR